MSLENYIIEKKKEKKILIMTHQILGYPSFETNEKVIDIFHKNQVDIIELQIPFSEPVADGPLFMKANQTAVDNGVRVKDCLDFIEKMASKYSDLPFLIMTYFNIVFKFGMTDFVKKCKEIGVRGLIVPDAQIDDANEFFEICKEHGLDLVGLATAYTNDNRLVEISQKSGGFIYYVPRKGVTGQKTVFDNDVLEKIRHVKTLSKKCVAVGFGISESEDVRKLCGVSDIAIIGSKVLKVIEEEGLVSLEAFMKDIAEGGIKRV